eukprot:SAG31_NODE_401_length_16206_cov_10.920780_8_plen_1034_part_00
MLSNSGVDGAYHSPPTAPNVVSLSGEAHNDAGRQDSAKRTSWSGSELKRELEEFVANASRYQSLLEVHPHFARKQRRHARMQRRAAKNSSKQHTAANRRTKQISCTSRIVAADPMLAAPPICTYDLNMGPLNPDPAYIVRNGLEAHRISNESAGFTNSASAAHLGAADVGPVAAVRTTHCPVVPTTSDSKMTGCMAPKNAESLDKKDQRANLQLGVPGWQLQLQMDGAPAHQTVGDGSAGASETPYFNPDDFFAEISDEDSPTAFLCAVAKSRQKESDPRASHCITATNKKFSVNVVSSSQKRFTQQNRLVQCARCKKWQMTACSCAQEKDTGCFDVLEDNDKLDIQGPGDFAADASAAMNERNLDGEDCRVRPKSGGAQTWCSSDRKALSYENNSAYQLLHGVNARIPSKCKATAESVKPVRANAARISAKLKSALRSANTDGRTLLTCTKTSESHADHEAVDNIKLSDSDSQISDPKSVHYESSTDQTQQTDVHRQRTGGKTGNHCKEYSHPKTDAFTCCNGLGNVSKACTDSSKNRLNVQKHETAATKSSVASVTSVGATSGCAAHGQLRCQRRRSRPKYTWPTKKQKEERKRKRAENATLTADQKRMQLDVLQTGDNRARNKINKSTATLEHLEAGENTSTTGIRRQQRKVRPMVRFQDEKFAGSHMQKSMTAGTETEDSSTWVQCDACCKWRRVPDGETLARFRGGFTCDQNTWDSRNRCVIAEEVVGNSAEEYVDAVVGRRMSRSGQIEYCLKWFGTSERTWELATNCEGCDALIAEYESRLPNACDGTAKTVGHHDLNLQDHSAPSLESRSRSQRRRSRPKYTWPTKKQKEERKRKRAENATLTADQKRMQLDVLQTGDNRARNKINKSTATLEHLEAGENTSTTGIRRQQRIVRPMVRFQDEKFAGSHMQKSMTAGTETEDSSTWVQCDACCKWRRVPDGETLARFRGGFTCDQNTWDSRNRCVIAEEAVGNSAEEYVDAVVGRRMSRSGQIEYCLKWFGTSERTWELATNCEGCDALIAEYEKS